MTEQNGSAVYVALDNRGVISLTGEDTIDFLQGLVSNDISQVTADRSIYATLLTPQGKFLFDFIVSAWPGGVLLDVEADRRADLVKRLTMYKLRSKVEIADLTDSHAVFAAFGGTDPAQALGLPSESGTARALDDGVAVVDPRMADLGVRVVAPAAVAKTLLGDAGFAAGSADDYERHRLTLGVPDGGRDILVDKSFLLESNVEELNGISFDKGCFVGQELTARTKHRGVVRKRIFQVQCDGPLPEAGTAIMRGDVEAGTMRSGIDHIGLALLRLEHVEAAAESGEPLTAGDTKVTAVKPAWVNF
jgi:folate-binding protein YgfZ